MTRSWTSRTKRIAAVIGIAAWTACLGCNPFACYQRRTTGLDFYGERHVTYYHYPGGNWFVPKQQKHHCPVITEPEFHGFASTCWTRWPEPWQPCPSPCLEPGACAPPGEVIEGRLHEVVPVPVPVPPGLDPEGRGAQRPREQPLATPRSIALQPPAEPAIKYEFHGQHGFSSPDDGAPGSAVAIELPDR
jgi:hypothetical protein